jgi:hypothetical protein
LPQSRLRQAYQARASFSEFFGDCIGQAAYSFIYKGTGGVPLQDYLATVGKYRECLLIKEFQLFLNKPVQRLHIVLIGMFDSIEIDNAVHIPRSAERYRLVSQLLGHKVQQYAAGAAIPVIEGLDLQKSVVCISKALHLILPASSGNDPT